MSPHVLDDLLRIAAPVRHLGARVDGDELHDPRQHVGERQEDVDDVVARREADAREDAVDVRAQVAVREHAALRRPGRAGGVDDRRDVVGADRGDARVEIGVGDVGARGAQRVERHRVVALALEAEDVLELAAARRGSRRAWRAARRPRRTAPSRRCDRGRTRTPPASWSGRRGRRRRRRRSRRSRRASTRRGCWRGSRRGRRARRRARSAPWRSPGRRRRAADRRCAASRRPRASAWRCRDSARRPRGRASRSSGRGGRRRSAAWVAAALVFVSSVLMTTSYVPS